MKQHNSFITLTDELGKGGEATVYNVARQPDMVAKLYHQPTPERAAKLRAMLLNPPEQPKNHTALAWPMALLCRQDDRLHAVATVDLDSTLEHVVGFLMPKISGMQAIFQIYNPAMRQQLPYPVDLNFRYRTATNLAVVVSALHARGYVIGDINESNILVNQQALVTLVDCDSFQVTDESGYIHRCPVGKPEFTPPELQGVSFKTVDQLPEHDLFGLGVLLFQLLMGGYHPFAGVLASQASVGRVDLYAIREGLFPYSDEPSINPPPAAPQFAWLHPEIQQLFLACFGLGHDSPAARPSGLDWQAGLTVGENSLRICEKKRHLYNGHLELCPHCLQQELQQIRRQYHFKAKSIPIKILLSLKQGVSAYHQKQADIVLAVMSEIIDSGYAPAEAHAYRAWAYHQQAELEASLAEASYAVGLVDDLPLAHYVMGRCYLEQQHHDKAVLALTRALDLGYEESHQLYYWRGMAQLNPTTARADFTQALDSPDKYWREQARERLEPLSLPVYPKTPPGITIEENGPEKVIKIQPLLWHRIGWISSYLAFCFASFLLCIGGGGLLLQFTVSTTTSDQIVLLYSLTLFLACFIGVTTLLFRSILNINQTTFIANQKTLTVRTGPLDPDANEYPVDEIQQLYCQRSFHCNSSPPTVTYQVYLATIKERKQLIAKARDYSSVRFVVWQLRDCFDLLDIPVISEEFIPAKPGRVYMQLDFKGLNKMLFELIEIHTFVLLCVFIVLILLTSISQHSWFLSCFGGICFSFGYLTLIVHQIWLANQLDKQGEVMTGYISDTVYTTTTGSKRGFYNHYHVYYRYLGYEARFEVSKTLFDNLSAGDSIKVCYLPHKPHISRPHPLSEYVD